VADFRVGRKPLSGVVPLRAPPKQTAQPRPR